MGIFTEAKLTQFSNAFDSIEKTLFGILTDVNSLHVLNAYEPIDTTPRGIEMVFKLIQSLNSLDSIFFLSGAILVNNTNAFSTVSTILIGEI